MRKYTEEFRNSLKDWRIERHSPDSPLLDTDTINIMARSFVDIVEGFDYVSKNKKMPPTSQRASIAKVVPALLLEDRLNKSPAIERYVEKYGTYKDDAKAAIVRQLLGSTIKDALLAAKEQNIKGCVIERAYFER